MNKTDLQALNLSGTYCHRTGTRPLSCNMPQQLTINTTSPLPDFGLATALLIQRLFLPAWAEVVQVLTKVPRHQEVEVVKDKRSSSPPPRTTSQLFRGRPLRPMIVCPSGQTPLSNYVFHLSDEFLPVGGRSKVVDFENFCGRLDYRVGVTLTV